MGLLDFLVLLIIAAICGALGEMIGGVKIPGGWLGSIVAGLVGAWIGGMLFHFGPVIGAIQVIPAIVGAILFVLVLRLIFNASRGTPTV
jgi:uncharacterized membrane protein YeaQ/YmgE (transglycosylase-associated protein family)